MRATYAFPHPPARARRSLWIDQALAAEPAADEQVEELSGAQRADVCIVGGGFTGLWTAIRLRELEPALDVALVEGDLCGTGASGRNGGCAVSWAAKLPTFSKLLGREYAPELVQASADAIGEIGSFCEEHRIGADFDQKGWLWVATSDAQRGAWDGLLRVADQAGVRLFEPLDPATGALRPPHVAGVFEPASATLQPAVLARGLRRVAVERGVRIYERSPVRAITTRPQVSVRSGRGTLTADKVVLAMNARMVHLPGLRRRVIAVSSDMIATEPVPERLREFEWTAGQCVSNSRMMIHYYSATADGRIAFGRGGGTLAFGGRIGSAFDYSPRQSEAVTREFRQLFPSLADVRLTHAWAGPIDRSKTGIPWVGRLDGDERVLYAIGYSGSGVAPSVLVGRMLASTLAGRDDRWSEMGARLERAANAGTLPPEPFRYVGGRLVQAALERKERAEDSGRPPGRIAGAVASLAPRVLPASVKDRSSTSP